MRDLIDRQELLSRLSWCDAEYDAQTLYTIMNLPSAQPDTPTHGSITPKTGENGDDRTTDDLISRRKAINTVEDAYRFSDGDIEAYHDLMVASLTELIAERKTGWWIQSPSHNAYKCSECGRVIETTDGKNNVCKHYPYCHCGCKMGVEHEG